MQRRRLDDPPPRTLWMLSHPCIIGERRPRMSGRENTTSVCCFDMACMENMTSEAIPTSTREYG